MAYQICDPENNVHIFDGSVTVCQCRKRIIFPPDDPQQKIQIAKRDLTKYRYDILVASFLAAMASIGGYGANTYGDFNWHTSRLEGDKGPINHIYKHLTSYREGMPYDHLEVGMERKFHLAAIAFNAMMEWWYEENLPLDK